MYCMLSAEHAESLPERSDGREIEYPKTTAVKRESGPKTESAIEEMPALTVAKERPASPSLSVVSSLTPEPESG
jgi:hypothetical protein